jgi:hypothetical protein
MDRTSAAPCLAVFVGIVVSAVAPAASAQTVERQGGPAPLLAQVSARVRPGEVVEVIDMSGAAIKGRLMNITAEEVQLTVDGDIRRVASARVQRVRWQQHDSLVNGLLIGAGIGAAHGIYWLVVDPNECTGLCQEDYAFIAIGAAIGAIVDRSVKRMVTVYSAGISRDQLGVEVVPYVSGRAQTLQIRLHF